MPTVIRRANLFDPIDAATYQEQLAAYAADRMGGGAALSREILQRTCSDLAQMPHAHAFLAFESDLAIGFATCLVGYSTFRAQPLWNIHDIAVLPAHRGRGTGRALLRYIAQQARTAGCCKLTLEVREDNPVAQHLYRSMGFQAARVGNKPVQYLFLERPLSDAQ
jgi:ribosomal protein S18 acetylase RimI-like enzyme